MINSVGTFITAWGAAFSCIVLIFFQHQQKICAINSKQKHGHSLAHICRVGHKNRTCFSVDNSAMVTCRKASNMSKVLEFCRQRGLNLHSKLFKYSLPNLHKSSLPPKIRHLHALPCARVHWIQKLTAKKSRLKFCELFSAGALQQRAKSQNISNWPAKTCANRA